MLSNVTATQRLQGQILESYADVQENPEEVRFTTVYVDSETQNVIGEVTYVKYHQPLSITILLGILAGCSLTVLVAAILVCCVQEEVLRRICYEVKWTKYYLLEKLNLLAYWLSSYGVLAPWADKSNREFSRRVTSNCRVQTMGTIRGRSSATDIDSDTESSSLQKWRSSTTPIMHESMRILRSDTEALSRRPTEAGQQHPATMRSFVRPPWEKQYVRKATEEYNLDFETTCGENCSLEFLSSSEPESKDDGGDRGVTAGWAPGKAQEDGRIIRAYNETESKGKVSISLPVI